MNLNYYKRSFLTKSYWSYALFTGDSVKTFMAILGAIWTFIEIGKEFKLIKTENIPLIYLLYFCIFSLLIVIFTRRPLTKITYNHPGQDISIEVRIDNLFNIPGQKIIGTNTTFDTALSDGIINPNSLQGQFTNKFFQTNLAGLDQQIEQQLLGLPNTTIEKKGKTKVYDYGTTVKFDLAGEKFYWFAMAEMNVNNNVKTNLKNLHTSLEGLWLYVKEQGDPADICIPLVGSAYGRIKNSRKKLIATIAHTFIIASEEHTFSPKLTIVVSPNDVQRFELNLFEVKDLLKHYLP